MVLGVLFGDKEADGVPGEEVLLGLLVVEGIPEEDAIGVGVSRRDSE